MDWSPASSSIGVGIAAEVRATFDAAVQPNTISFTLTGPNNAAIPGRISYNAANNTETFDPNAPLAYSTTYTATVSGAASKTWTFTTGVDPTIGPGGPILVITSTADPFSSYYAEILRAEGLNEFDIADIAAVSASTLTTHDIVILGEMPLTSNQVSMLSDWVNAGGHLIAMRPDSKLTGLLGLSATTGTLSDAYLLVNTTSGPGAGITDQTMQFHGAADLYNLNGATSLATLYSNATTATSNPAVTLRSVGTNGGQAAAFTYDLASSIVYTRQGNPAWDGQERDGYPPIRSDDLFYGGASPDWVNLDKVSIPQADEQQRLLANLLTQMELDKEPLPRFWYFPNGVTAMILQTGDDHGNGGTAGQFNTFLADGTAGGQPIRASSYVYPGTPLTDAEAARYTAQGFEIGLHVNTNVQDWTPAQLDSDFTNQLSQWLADYPSLPTPSSSRTHAIVWSTYADQPQIELNHRIRLDTNYYYWPPDWIQDRPGMFTGSGMPMRFANKDGTMIDVYQAATQMTDESGQSYPYTVDALLDAATGPLGYYGVFADNAHTDTPSSSVADAVISSAQAHNVPVVSGRQLLGWLDYRDNSSFGSLSWNATAKTLSFTITTADNASGLPAGSLQAMVPLLSTAGKLTGITQNGSAVAYTTQRIKGVDYAFFSAAPGSYTAQYASDTQAPSVSSLWPSSAVPRTLAYPDTGAVELGVQFKSDVAGTITGIRYYKSSSNTGTHVGNLWTAGGQLLATATFTNETASGWQQVNFASPVEITAGTVYVASYHTDTGYYSADANYFATSGVDNGPLHALSDAEGGGNGVYRYGSGSAFPDSTYNANNYWVDVVFSPDTGSATMAAVASL